MNILFISKYCWPHIGGVEKHVREVGLRLRKKGHKVTIISEKDIKYPHIKYLGLLYIWHWLFKNRDLIARSDLVHVHDVFIWYLPFRFLYPKKVVYTTFHGWEGVWPIPFWNILQKKTANKLSNGTVAVGKYIEKYYGIKSDIVLCGAVDKVSNSKIKYKKKLDTIVYLGRLDKDTGIEEFRKWLKIYGKDFKVKYISNSKSPEKYLKTAEYCVPAGYLSYLEAKNFGCKILTFPNNPLKVDYWNEIKNKYSVSENGKKIPTWDDMVNIYLKLWGNTTVLVQ